MLLFFVPVRPTFPVSTVTSVVPPQTTRAPPSGQNTVPFTPRESQTGRNEPQIPQPTIEQISRDGDVPAGATLEITCAVANIGNLNVYTCLLLCLYHTLNIHLCLLGNKIQSISFQTVCFFQRLTYTNY